MYFTQMEATLLYTIETYGCQMNVHESEEIAGILEYLGYQETKDVTKADIVVFNTCCIRDNAEQKIFGNIGALKKVKRANPDLIVCVVGCMSQQKNYADIIKKRYPFVNIILGTANSYKLEEYIKIIASKKKKTIIDVSTDEKPAIQEDVKMYRTSGTNAWINIMYGCNNFCTYCIVPYVRGRERSRLPENIYKEFVSLVNEGYKEITLLGQNVNSYGHDLEAECTFAELLRMVDSVEGDHRIRFMTNHPKDLTDDVIDVIAQSTHICHSIHLPIQSGSSRVLKLMNRHYTKEQYLALVERIRAKIPDTGITTDIMVGFPGESEEDFLDTIDLVEKVRFSTAFTFVYSVRKGTKAATMEQVPDDIKKDRIQRLIKVQNRITKELSRDYEGNTYRILCEDMNEKLEGKALGRTDSGRLVNFDGTPDMIGTFVNVKIEHSQSATLFGEVVE